MIESIALGFFVLFAFALFKYFMADSKANSMKVLYELEKSYTGNLETEVKNQRTKIQNLAAQLAASEGSLSRCQADLEQALKNDHRDKPTGQYKKAPKK